MFLYILISCGGAVDKGKQINSPSNRDPKQELSSNKVPTTGKQFFSQETLARSNQAAQSVRVTPVLNFQDFLTSGNINVKDLEELEGVLTDILSKGKEDWIMNSKVKFNFKSFTFTFIEALILLKDWSIIERTVEKSIALKTLPNQFTQDSSPKVAYIFRYLSVNEIRSIIKKLDQVIKKNKLVIEKKALNDFFISVMSLVKIELIEDLFETKALKPDLLDLELNNNPLEFGAKEYKSYNSRHQSEQQNMEAILLFLIEKGMNPGYYLRGTNTFISAFKSRAIFLEKVKDSMWEKYLENMKNTIRSLRLENDPNLKRIFIDSTAQISNPTTVTTTRQPIATVMDQQLPATQQRATPFKKEGKKLILESTGFDHKKNIIKSLSEAMQALSLKEKIEILQNKEYYVMPPTEDIKLYLIDILIIIGDETTLKKILQDKSLKIEFFMSNLKNIMEFFEEALYFQEEYKLPKNFLNNINLAISQSRLKLSEDERNNFFSSFVVVSDLEMVKEIFKIGALKPNLKNLNNRTNPLSKAASSFNLIKPSISSMDKHDYLENLKKVILFLLESGINSECYTKDDFPRNFVHEFKDDKEYLEEIKSRIPQDELMKMKKNLRDIEKATILREVLEI